MCPLEWHSAIAKRVKKVSANGKQMIRKHEISMPMSQCSPAHGQTESRKRATTFTTSSFLEKARLTAQLHM